MELAELKVEAAMSSVASPTLNTDICTVSSLSPISMHSEKSEANSQNDYVPMTNSAHFPTKMEKLQENENEMLYYEFEVSFKPKKITILIKLIFI